LLNQTAQPFHDLSSELRRAIPPLSPASSDDEQTPKNITVFYCKSLGTICNLCTAAASAWMQLPSAPHFEDTLAGMSGKREMTNQSGSLRRISFKLSVAMERAGT
jgi:hypothetical protein